MIRDRVWYLALVAVFAGATAMALFPATPASTATGAAGPATVTVTPSSGLGDGQTVTIHAETPPGTELFEIRAHICLPGATISNYVDFGYQGPYCVAQGGIKVDGLTGDYETSMVPDNRQSGDLTFRAGTGSVGWLDENGSVHTLACGPGSACDLVVQLQITNDTVFFATPLCFGGGCPAEPGTEAVPPPPAASEQPPESTPSAEATDAGAAAPADAPPNPVPAASNTGPAASDTGPAATPTESAPNDAPANNGSSTPNEQALGSATQQASLVLQPEGMPTGFRVFAGEAAGLAGGVLIVVIILRARKRMALDLAQSSGGH